MANCDTPSSCNGCKDLHLTDLTKKGCTDLNSKVQACLDGRGFGLVTKPVCEKPTDAQKLDAKNNGGCIHSCKLAEICTQRILNATRKHDSDASKAPRGKLQLVRAE